MPRLVVAPSAANFSGGHAPHVVLLVQVPVAADFDIAPFGKEVHNRDAHAVQDRPRVW